MNKIITLSNVGYKIDDNNFIKNLNLDFYSGENVLISGKDNVISNLMIDLIIGFIKPQIGNVTTQVFNEKRYFIGYKNFESVLKHGAQVQDIINTLVSSQRYVVNDDEEVNELIGLFGLNKIFNKSTNELTSDQLFLLNFAMLLIVKPRVIVLKQLPLAGSTNFQLSTLKYVYNYTKKYDISLILTTDDKVVIENLIDRQLQIENGKIMSDVSISVIANYQTNTVDNKTKEFNLENVLNNALNFAYPENGAETVTADNVANVQAPVENNSSYKTTPISVQKTEQIEIDLPLDNATTKTVKINFDVPDHKPAPSIVVDDTDNHSSVIDDLKTTSSSTIADDANNYSNIIDDLKTTSSSTITDDATNYSSVIDDLKTTSSSTIADDATNYSSVIDDLKTTSSLNNYPVDQTNDQIKDVSETLDQHTPVVKKTHEFLINDDDVFKFNTSAIEDDNYPTIKTNQVTDGLDVNMVTKRLTEITKEFEIITAKQNFTDPFETSNDYNQNHLLTNKLAETQTIKKELDDQIKSPEFTNLSINLQAQILDNLDKANQIIDENERLATTQIELNDESVTTVLMQEQLDSLQNVNDSPYRTSVIDSEIYEFPQDTNDVKPDIASKDADLFYYDNEKPNSLYDLWRKKRKTKTKSLNENFNNSSSATTDTDNDSSKNADDSHNLDEQIDNFTTNLKFDDVNDDDVINLKASNPEPEYKYTNLYNIDMSGANEPTKEIMNDLNNDHASASTSPLTSNNQYEDLNDADTHFNDSDQSAKTMEAKRRSKLNSIEKLYQEALDDLNAVEEQKNQK